LRRNRQQLVDFHHARDLGDQPIEQTEISFGNAMRWEL
jgi:hypothetical protein